MFDRRLLPLCLIVLAASCASDPAHRQAVAEAESIRLAAPSEPLKNFSAYQLAELALTADLRVRPEKVAVADRLESFLRQKLEPLLADWQAQATAGGPKLVITPVVTGLHVPSGSSRFWVGPATGDSFINMQLRLSDAESGQEIGTARVSRSASAMTGSWSVGRSDRHLLLYIVDIAHQYLVDNYAFDD